VVVYVDKPVWSFYIQYWSVITWYKVDVVYDLFAKISLL